MSQGSGSRISNSIPSKTVGEGTPELTQAEKIKWNNESGLNIAYVRSYAQIHSSHEERVWWHMTEWELLDTGEVNDSGIEFILYDHACNLVH